MSQEPFEKEPLDQGDTVGEILGVHHVWRKVGVIALAVGALYGADQYVDYKVDQVTEHISEQLDEQVNTAGQELGNQVADTIETRLRDSVLNYLLESNNG